MRHALAPISGEPGDREGEDERIIAAAVTVINPYPSTDQSNTRKEVNQMVQGRRYGRSGRSHAPRPSHLRHPRTYKVTCSGCGKEVVTPVPPPNDKKLLCIQCFNRTEISKEE